MASIHGGQHYFECGREDCKRNCQFYCNSCHQPLCVECRDDHIKSMDTKSHQVVLYRDRKRQLPVEECKIHRPNHIDLHCDECQVPLCSKCTTTLNHRGHTFSDLEQIFAKTVLLYQNEIAKIQACILPTAQGLRKEIAEDATKIRKTIDGIKEFIKAEAKSVKSMVDTVTEEKLKQVNDMEQSLKEDLKIQDETIECYINYVYDQNKKFHGYLSSPNIMFLISTLSLDSFKIDPIPETTKPVPPVYTPGQYRMDDVTKLLGKINLPVTKPEKREIKPMESASTDLKFKGRQSKKDREKSDMKQTLSLSPSVTKVREYKVPGVFSACHISLHTFDELWANDYFGNLVQTDMQGNLLQNMQTTDGRFEGFHTVAQDGHLIFTDKMKKEINRITLENKIKNFIKTDDWEPLSIHSSHINGDILVGMTKNEMAKITRYNKTGKEIQKMQRDNQRETLYRYPHFITENINGDICASDFYKLAVVVVNKSGQHRFSYSGQMTGRETPICPCGIGTDVLGHILVCDAFSKTVHLVDQGGKFLRLLLTPQHGVEILFSLCIDDDNNLYIGQDNNTVTVYKYLQ